MTKRIALALMIACSAPMVSGCIPSCTQTAFGCMYF